MAFTAKDLRDPYKEVTTTAKNLASQINDLCTTCGSIAGIFERDDDTNLETSWNSEKQSFGNISTTVTKVCDKLMELVEEYITKTIDAEQDIDARVGEINQSLSKSNQALEDIAAKY